MAATKFLNLRAKAANLAELVTSGLSTPRTELDAIYGHASKLLGLIGELRIVEAADTRHDTVADTSVKASNEEDLLNSLTDMYALSSGALERTRGIARCALRALETDAGVSDLEAIAGALLAIIVDVDSVHGCVSVEAEKHGIQTIEESWNRRLQAMANRPKLSAQNGGVQ